MRLVDVSPVASLCAAGPPAREQQAVQRELRSPPELIAVVEQLKYGPIIELSWRAQLSGWAGRDCRAAE